MKSVLGKRGARKITSALGVKNPGESTLIAASVYLEKPLAPISYVEYFHLIARLSV